LRAQVSFLVKRIVRNKIEIVLQLDTLSDNARTCATLMCSHLAEAQK
jgi:hypothetical protein